MIKKFISGFGRGLLWALAAAVITFFLIEGEIWFITSMGDRFGWLISFVAFMGLIVLLVALGSGIGAVLKEKETKS